MKNIRNAAVAAAAALSLTLGGITAVAQETNDNMNPPAPAPAEKDQKEETPKDGEQTQDSNQQSDQNQGGTDQTAPSGTDQPEQNNDANQGIKGFFGSSEKTFDKDGKLTDEGRKEFETDKPTTGDDALANKDQPAWAQLWKKITAIGLAGSFIGLIVFPIINFLKFQGIIR